MASISDLGINSHFIGGHFALTSDENRGGIGLLVKRTKEIGGTNVWESLSSAAPFSVSRTLKRRRPEKRRFTINVPINGSVDSSEGVVAFNCPTDRSFRVVEISESHQALEATAAECNLQVAINPDATAVNAATARKFLTPNEIDVETEGIAVNTFSKARLKNGQLELTSGSHSLAELAAITPDRGGNLFTVPAGKSFEVVSLSAVWSVASNSGTSQTLLFEKLTGTEAPAGGTSLHASGTIDLKGTAETVQNVALATANATKALAAGDRISFFADETGGANTQFNALCLTWEVRETTAGINGSADKIVRPGERVMVYFEQDDGLTAQDTTEYRGNVTVTLEEVEAEEHQEKIVTANFSDQDNLAATGLCVFTAEDHRWRVKSIEESHAVVDDGTTANLKAERCQGTEAAAAGDDLLTATAVDLKATINTVITPTLTTTGDRDILEIGDRLVLHAANDAETAIALGTYDGVVTVVLAPELSTPTTQKVVSVPLEKAILVTGSDIFIADQDYRLTGVSMTPVIIETTVTNPSIMLEKLSDGQAVEGGTDLVSAQALDADATVDTVQHVTPTAANAIITNGQRISLYGTDDDSSDAAVALTEFRGGITLFLEPINDAQGTLEASFLYTNDTGQTMKVLGVSAIWETAETHATTLNLQVERLQGTEVVGAGDKLIGDTNISVKGTKNTRNTGTIVSSGVEVLAVTDRLGIYFVNDAGTRVNPGDLNGLEVTVGLIPTSLEAKATS